MRHSKANTDKPKDPDDEKCEEYAAKRFVDARKKLGLTQTQLIELLANRYGESYDPKTLYRWENGITPVPASVIFRLEMFLAELSDDNKEQITKELVFSQKHNMLQRVLGKMNDYLNKRL